MKNFPRFIFATIVLVTLSLGAFAQTTTGDAANAAVSATVLTPLNVTNVAGVAFGQVITGVAPSLNPVTGATTEAGSAAVIGKFNITGSATATVNVTWSTPIVMTTGGGTPKLLDFNPAVSFLAGQSAAAFGGAVVTSAHQYTINAAGEDTFWVGGTLTATAGGNIGAAAQGVYSGTFTLTAQYN